MKFGDRLRQVRENKGFSAYKISKMANLDQALYSKIENNHRSPSDLFIEKISGPLDLPIAHLKAWVALDQIGDDGLRYISDYRDRSAMRLGEPERLDVMPAGGMLRLPVFGEVPCGLPNEAPDYPESWENWPQSIAGNADDILIVRGESMLGAGFKPGDRLFLKRMNGAVPTPGDEVIAQVDGQITCKIFRGDRLGYYLESAPGDGQPWRIPVDDSVQFISIVVGLYSDRRQK